MGDDLNRRILLLMTNEIIGFMELESSTDDNEVRDNRQERIDAGTPSGGVALVVVVVVRWVDVG